MYSRREVQKMAGKPHCEGRFVKPRRKFEDNIEIDSQETG
jgi:hypothetical protein